MLSVEFVGAESGVVVLKMSERRFPGVLVQGDTLLSLLQDLEEESPDTVAIQTVRSWLRSYEVVLERNGLELPYPRRPEGNE